MNIAILNIYSGVVNRGAETVVHQLALHLCEKHQVTLFQAGKSSDKNSYQTINIPGIIHIRTDPSSLYNKLEHALYVDPYNQQVKTFTQQVVDHFNTLKPDIILSFNGVNQLKVLKQYQAQHRYKIIYSNQGQFHPSFFKLAGFDNYQKLRTIPDAFVSLTPQAHKWAIKNASKQTICKYIPNGVDLDQFNPQNKPFNIELPHPVVLCVAALQPYKQIDLLINAMAKIPTASLLVLGTGPLKEELEQQASQKLKNFKILSVPHDQMPNVYTAADVFTLPSLPLEAFGVAYLEALASNLPIVAPDDPGRRSIIGDAGVYCNVNNPHEYASAIDTALNTNWHQKPHQQAERFSWPKIVEQYHLLIMQLGK